MLIKTLVVAISGLALAAPALARDEIRIVGSSTVFPYTQAVAETREVTILADRTVPFSVVEQVMSTCTAEGYENVSLAVTQKSAPQVASL